MYILTKLLILLQFIEDLFNILTVISYFGHHKLKVFTLYFSIIYIYCDLHHSKQYLNSKSFFNKIVFLKRKSFIYKMALYEIPTIKFLSLSPLSPNFNLSCFSLILHFMSTIIIEMQFQRLIGTSEEL